MDSDISGFANLEDGELQQLEKEKSVPKTRSKSKKSGGFQSMGLSAVVMKGLQKRGYKIPSPIQRKTIPIVLEGSDVVAMARTGSGKTACFLIPLFEKLKSRCAKTGARALILSPTRELALQTLKFIKELGRFTGLQTAVILGGDSMDNQFSALHGNPDIIVATPGRLLHICVEMDLHLKSVQYIVFDEADRLFEMGFGEQLREIMNRLPENRQTLLFSATLPKVLVEFAKAGLSDPVLVRLDVESMLPEQLKLLFFICRSDEKLGALLCLLKNVVKAGSQSVLFAATKHHVEYLHMVLDRANISNTYIYSNLDPSARKINAAKFQVGKVSVLIVTDIAARGIDIPQLDYVINYNFPAKPKLFVHRVGRCARAGRSGTAFSLVSSDEYPYLLDLHIFLGRPLNLECKGKEEALGLIPPSLMEEELSELNAWETTNTDLANMKHVCKNAYKQYLRSRPGASVESVKRVKETDLAHLKPHPIFGMNEASNNDKYQILDQMKKYRPNGTVFEIGQGSNSAVYSVMKTTRQKHHNSIVNHKRKVADKEERDLEIPALRTALPGSNIDDIVGTFQRVITPKPPHMDSLYKPPKKKRKVNVDIENFIPYTAPDHHSEQGLAVNSFQSEALKAQLDLTGDSEEMLKLNKQLMRWDRKKKKMVAVNKDSKVGKIRTESGAWIPATYKSNRYAQWKEKSKVDADESGDDSDGDRGQKMVSHCPNTQWSRHNEKMHQRAKSELKRPEQILKTRIEMEKKRQKYGRKKKSKSKKRS